MDRFGGRPHWGKLHFQTRGDARAAVSGVGALPAVLRARLDPDGRFANAYLDRVLGPMAPAAPDGS